MSYSETRMTNNNDLSMSNRIIHIASMPKAGTYFFKELICALGFNDRKLHCHGDSVTRIVGNEFGATFPEVYIGAPGLPYRAENTFDLNFRTLLLTLLPRDVFVSHLPPHRFPYDFQNVITTVLCIRNPYRALERDYLYGRRLLEMATGIGPSKLTFPAREGAIEFLRRSCGHPDLKNGFLMYLEANSDLVRSFTDLQYWKGFNSCQIVRYEDFMDELECGRVMQNLAAFLDVELTRHEAEKLCEICKSTATATLSRGQVDYRDDIWTDEAYESAERLRLPEIAALLGYNAASDQR